MSFITRSAIPSELWLNEMIHMPRAIVQMYEQLLIRHNIMDKARSDVKDKGIYGGLNLDETLEHFARRYGVSFCRVEALVIDPADAFSSISNDLQISLSTGRIAILDIPCGSGAAGCALLSTVAVLRARGLMPKLPLTVDITAGDYSQHALNLYREALNLLSGSLNAVGIKINFATCLWDATKPEETSQLCDRLLKGSVAEEFLIIVANFSGSGAPSFERFQRSFDHIHQRLSDQRSTILWVEPGGMKSAKQFLSKLVAFVQKYIDWFSSEGEKDQVEHEYTWYHPLLEFPLPCKILVQKYVRSK